MSQLTYNLNPALGVAGMVAESREANVIISKVAQGLVTVGLMGVPGTNQEIGMQPNTASASSTSPGQIKAMPVGAQSSPLDNSLYIGVPIYDSSRPPYTALNQYSDGDYVGVLIKGVIWVQPDAAVTAYSTKVYVWVNPGGGDPAAGTFTTGTQGGKACLISNGQYLTSTTSAQPLAILQLW